MPQKPSDALHSLTTDAPCLQAPGSPLEQSNRGKTEAAAAIAIWVDLLADIIVEEVTNGDDKDASERSETR